MLHDRSDQMMVVVVTLMLDEVMVLPLDFDSAL